MNTFTTRAISNTEQNSRVKQLEEINRNALQALKAGGITVQTSPFPLALATISGSARTGSKSTMRSVLQKQIEFQACFTNNHPTNLDNFSLITDFMCYIHMPPPSNTATYSEYFNYLWNISMNHNATSIIYVFDKPNYLPPPRQIVHENRAKGKSKTHNFQQIIDDNSPIPHNREYTSLLTVQEYKSRLIQYLTNKLIYKCIQESNKTTSLSFIIDSPALSSVAHIQDGNLNIGEQNEHGEGDVGVWYHCLLRSEQKIMLVSSDTDVWMYGLLVTELSPQLQSKQVYVKCLNSSPTLYVNVTRLYESVTTHPQLGKIFHPCTSLVALYIATGSDYLSFFYRITKQKFFTIFLNNLDFICCNNKFVHFFDNSIAILEDSWIKLITSAYFYQHPTFFQI